MRIEPGSILVHLVTLGVALGAVIWSRNQVATAPRPQEEVSPRGTNSSPGEIGKMQDQVEYLQGQVEALEEANAQLRAQAAPSLAEEVASMRGDQFLSLPQVEDVGRAGLREDLVVMLRERGADGWAKRVRAWSTLGLVPADFDAVGAMVDLFVEVRGAYYLTEDNAFYAVEGWVPDIVDFGRALALRKIVDGDPWFESGGDLDRQMARLAVLEGDARFVEFQAKLRSMGAVGGPSAGKPDLQDVRDSGAAVPVFLREAFVGFPSQVGFPAMRDLHAEGGYEAIDGWLASPPSTSAELIDGELVEPFLGQAPEVAGAAAFFEGSLGQAAQVLMLKAWVPESMAIDASTSWAGDRLAAYASPAGDHVVLATDFLDVDAAERYFKAMRKTLLNRLGVEFTDPMVGADPLVVGPAPRGGRFASLGIIGRRVLLVDSADAEWRDALSTAWAEGGAQ